MKARHISGNRSLAKALALAVVIGIAASSSGKADLAGFLAGKTINDAMDKSRALVQQARDAGFALMAQGDKYAKERIEQVDALADRSIASIVALEKQTFADANELTMKINSIIDDQQKKLVDLERQIMADLSEKIREVECAADRILNEKIKDALGSFGTMIGSNEITITPPLLYSSETIRCWVVMSCRPERTFKIYTPFTETFREIQIYLERRISESRADTPSRNIWETYALLGNLAKRSTCFANPYDKTYEREFIKYNVLVRRWALVLNNGG